ncbi:MAG: hypothetical protein LBU23_10465 [Planctomycetota bacterium]|jgi:uncharacterized protein (DUF1778 family)|nr:hypothetical protein [Planctomycetota bacterium]
MAKKMGRPSKGNDGKRILINMRITPLENEAWHKAADALGVSFSEYVLSYIRKHHKPKREGK